MSSLAAKLDASTFLADLQREGGNLLRDDGLEAAVLISLFTHRRSPIDLVEAGGDRKGWWGDAFPQVTGDEIGSLLWTAARSHLTQAVVEEMRGFVEQALEWMRADGVVDSIAVQIEQRRDIVLFTVDLQRPQDPTSRWQKTWEVRFGF